jgi:hypothetical protein
LKPCPRRNHAGDEAEGGSHRAGIQAGGGDLGGRNLASKREDSTIQIFPHFLALWFRDFGQNTFTLLVGQRGHPTLENYHSYFVPDEQDQPDEKTDNPKAHKAVD